MTVAIVAMRGSAASIWRYPDAGDLILRQAIGALRAPARVLIFASPPNPAGPAIAREEFAAPTSAVPAGTLVVFGKAPRKYLDPECVFEP